MVDCVPHFGIHVVSNGFCYASRTFMCLLIIIIPFANAQLVSFDYPNIGLTHQYDLNLQGDANYSLSGGILLTGNTEKPEKASSSGRVTSSKPINLRDHNSKEKYDFTTSFTFVIYSKNQTYHGDGLAFFLASSNLPIGPDGIGYGGSLGLLGSNNFLPDGYSFVAVEFDTFQNFWDPKANHVGVDVNSMVSYMYQEWLADISEEGKVYNCSIQYSSRNKHLEVFFTGGTFNGLETQQHLSCQIDLTDYLTDSVIVGISAATGNWSEEHRLLSWSFRTKLPDNANPKKKRNKILMEGIGIGIGLCASSLVLVLAPILIWKSGKGKDEPTSDSNFDRKMDHEFQMGTGPKRISYDILLSATNNFEEANKLGNGGFGGVYKGYFKDTNSYAAIKKISADSRQGLKEYAAEVKIISQLRHRNLVRLTGWCHQKNDFILIYEYMPNGSLHSCLFEVEGILSWKLRYSIALGLASALLYLQEEWEQCVLHRDIKSSNIMLDSNFNAKLGDFGLARLVDHEKCSRTTVTAGTMGYIAPEYMKTGKVRKESDIYSFGVVLLEIASGKKAIHQVEMEGRVTQVSLVEWVWELYGLRNVFAASDPRLCGEFEVQQMECLLVVGLWCAHPDCTLRPSIRQVIKVLNFEAPLPILPQRMPLPITCLPSTTNELFLTASSSFLATS